MSSTRTPERPAAPGRPRRRRGLWAVLAVVVVLAVAAFVGPRIYASVESGKAAAPLVASTAAGSATPTAASTDATLDGAWTLAPGGTAGYRVKEVLNGQDVTVTGRTSDVTGDLTVAGGRLTAGTVSVGLASVETDSGQRDNQFRTTVIDVARFPTADVALTAPVPLGGLDVGSSVAVNLVGTLTLKGSPRDVTVPATVQRTAQGSVTVTGSLPVTWSEHGVQAPDLGFVKVEDTGTIEFTFTATKA
ncbi:YceI family protein [Kineococcus rhizosphaerae]|uniref:Polyisoprenoid-binding protein YceI n=1 Tax=Kineococcus rhizosphaerae TaxID=559628 RepID=A0A2T0R5W5_9ACTN|nr:YceI family protein [Kineococcus rhizosphaerae]PRY16156.1 polyisoprenoid-binding protein YceI [Kineococcus rhizosphaerae]